VEPIRNELSKSQDCKAANMLRFLFSFCASKSDAAEVEPEDDKLISAFGMVQELASDQDTLRSYIHEA